MPRVIQIEGKMDSHAAEALRLDILRLAKKHNVDLSDLVIRRVVTPNKSFDTAN